MALNHETAKKDVTELNAKPADTVDKTRSPDTTRKSPGSGRDNKQKYMSCGEGDHRRSECSCRNFACHSCGKHGHISGACKSSNGVHQLEHTSLPESTPDFFIASMHKVGSNKEAIMIPIEIQGQSLLMEIYTGASISIIWQETYQKHLSNIQLVHSCPTNQNGLFEGFGKDPILQPDAIRRHELSTEQRCIMWGPRVVIPPSLRKTILAELHESHPGVARMKAIAPSHLWWPKLDADIEETVRCCNQCVKPRSATALMLLIHTLSGQRSLALWQLPQLQPQQCVTNHIL